MPVRGYFSVGRFNRRFDIGHLVRELRGEDEVLVAGAVGIELDACRTGVEPIPNRAERIMVEGIHGRGLIALVRRPAVPALPHRRGAIPHGKQPRGVGIREEQLPREVRAADLRQHRAEESGAGKARRQMAILGNIIRQPLRDGGADIFRRKVEPQCKDIRSLRVARAR